MEKEENRTEDIESKTSHQEAARGLTFEEWNRCLDILVKARFLDLARHFSRRAIPGASNWTASERSRKTLSALYLQQSFKEAVDLVR